MKKFAFNVAMTALIALSSCAPALPPEIRVCYDRSKIADCVKHSVELLRPQLKTGQLAPGFKIEGLDPLFIGTIAVNPGFELKLFDMQVFGIIDFKIDKLLLNLVNFKMEMIATLPKLTLKAFYALNWKIALLNLQGEGDAQAFLENTKIKIKVTGSRYLNKGSEYLKIDTALVVVQPAQLKVRFENLFKGQKKLEDVANEVINQNVHLLQDAVVPEVERGIEKKILIAANQVFEKAPMKDFFPLNA